MSLSAATKDRLKAALGRKFAADEIDASLSLSTGDVYYVSSATGVGADVQERSGQSKDQPFATLDYAIGRTTASQGDIIVLMPGHAETTTAIAADVAGIAIVGLGYGRNRPALTATTGASDLISVTAANVQLHNVRLVGAASGVTALLNIGAADFTGDHVVFEHGAAPLIAVTVVAGSHRFKLVDCEWYGTAAGPDVCVNLEFTAATTTDNWQILRPYAAYGGSSGLDLAFLKMDVSGTGYAVLDAVIIGFDAVAIDINSSTLAVGDGVITGDAVSSAAITWANANDAGGAIFTDFRVSDDPAARGKLWPAATPA